MTEDHEKKEGLIEEAEERYKLAQEAWKDNQQAALEDMKFRAGDHWPEKVRREREKSNRPCLTFDKLNQYIRQVVNDGRQNRPSIKVRPVDDSADKDCAEVYQGIIRHIWDRSNADEAVDSAFEGAVVGGFGYFRVLTEYAHEGTFNQEIGVGRIRNPMTVLLGEHFKADGSDAKYGFVVEEVPKEEFRRKYPKAQYVDWKSDAGRYSDGWVTDKNVRVCEYWYKEEEDRTLHLLESGETVEDELYQKALNEGLTPPAIKDSRDIPVEKVKWCRLTGAEVLEKKDWAGKYIPIIPVYGNEYDIDGKVTYSGLIRSSKDANRLYDYENSNHAEVVALQPKAPYIAAAGQVEDHSEWENANTENYSVLTYEPVSVDGVLVPPPSRQPPVGVSPAYLQAMQLREHDIQTALGMYNSSLGAQSNEKSGKAILARQREGDVGTFHYQDNLSRAIRHLGRILIDLIPKIYDTRRVVRILGEDGKAETASIDPEQTNAVTKIGAKTIYNLNVGKYDLTVSAGPSYTTKRQEAAEGMLEVTRALPESFKIIGDKLVRALDWPEADEIADRLKLMLPPEIQKAEHKEGEVSPEVQNIMTQAEQAIQQRDEALQQLMAQMQEMQSELKDAKEQVAIKERETEIKAYDAETKRIQALSTAMTPETVQSIVMQTIQQLQTPGKIDSSPPEEPIPQQPPQGGFFMPEENPLAGS